MTQRFRNICFTINNPTDIDYSEVLTLPYSYLVMGEEVGENGTPHIQGYVEFKKQMGFNAIKKLVPRMHFEARKGTAKEAAQYCMKDGDYTEYGELSNQGKRNDLTYIKKEVTEKGRIKPILGDIWNLQQLKFAEGLLQYSDARRNGGNMVDVQWIWGPTGSGKTRYAVEYFENLDEEYYVWKKGQGKWFNGYDGEENVIFDDLRPGDFDYTELLGLLDRHPYRVQFKGGVREFMAKKIIITSSMHPTAFKILGEDNKQLLRRITTITKMEYDKTSSEAQKSGGNTSEPPPTKRGHSIKSLVTGVED